MHDEPRSSVSAGAGMKRWWCSSGAGWLAFSPGTWFAGGFRWVAHEFGRVSAVYVELFEAGWFVREGGFGFVWGVLVQREDEAGGFAEGGNSALAGWDFPGMRIYQSDARFAGRHRLRTARESSSS